MKYLISQNHKYFRMVTGFTLIEILLVMLLVSILVLGINAAYRQAHAFWSRITATQPVYAQSRMVLDTLRQELSTLYLPQAQQGEEGPEPPAFFSVKSGTEISFLTLNPAWNVNPAVSKPAKVTYAFKKSDDIGTLTRSEQPYSGEKAIGAETQTQIILTRLDNLQIQVLERDSDDDSWKSDLECKEKPPHAVKIQLIYPKGKNDNLIFETVVPIFCNTLLMTSAE